MLFELARQAVKYAGYQYSKGHSRSQYSFKLFDNESNSLSENNDSIDIETFKEDEDKDNSHDSNDTLNSSRLELSRINRNMSKKYFANLQDQKMMNGVGGNCKSTINQLKEENRLLIEDERKHKLDRVEMINKQIEFNNEQIEKLRIQLELKELNENEVLPRLIKLEEDQKLLIEEKNNLLKQIQKLDR